MDTGAFLVSMGAAQQSCARRICLSEAATIPASPGAFANLFPQVAGDVLRIHLPELRAMDLKWCSWRGAGDGLTLDQRTFRDAGKLEALSLQQLVDTPKTVTLTSWCLAPLTMLKDLKLAGCGLTGVPPAVAELSASLTSLSLEHNVDLQLCETDIGTLLELRCLKELDVHKVYEDDPDTANLWSNDSIQVLIDLPGRFMTQHGAAPAVIFYPYTSWG